MKTNEFTEVYQQIIDTYGVTSYKEVNPAVYACVTFPFLFGIMFGDMGHGGMLFLFSAFIVFFEPQLQKTTLKDLLFMRYLLLLMGFFAFYCGLMYNDFLSLPLQLFDSCYDLKTG